MLKSLYQKYLALHLPGRRVVLAGIDDASQTSYWHLIVPGSPRHRRLLLPYVPNSPFEMRRSPANTHPSEYERFYRLRSEMDTAQSTTSLAPQVAPSHAEIPVQWSQWLRHARTDAPTVDEIASDVTRKLRLKALVDRAEAKWITDNQNTIPAALPNEVEHTATHQPNRSALPHLQSPSLAPNTTDEPLPWKPRHVSR